MGSPYCFSLGYTDAVAIFARLVEIVYAAHDLFGLAHSNCAMSSGHGRRSKSPFEKLLIT